MVTIAQQQLLIADAATAVDGSSLANAAAAAAGIGARCSKCTWTARSSRQRSQVNAGLQITSRAVAPQLLRILRSCCCCSMTWHMQPLQVAKCC
jgi:hypothetical protein